MQLLLDLISFMSNPQAIIELYNLDMLKYLEFLKIDLLLSFQITN